MREIKTLVLYLLAFVMPGHVNAQKAGGFNGIETNLSNLFRLSDAKTRSISPENFTGEAGRGGMTLVREGVA